MCYNTRENIPNELNTFCKEKGIEIKPSPAYAPQSNGILEILVQELWLRACVLLLSSEITLML